MQEQGFCVYTADTDGLGTVENNAEQLKKQINKILQDENAEKINIIAHSKGGLDSIFMIENLDMVDKVASLTTLCTPHKGSQIATKILNMPSFLIKVAAFVLNSFYKMLKDEQPDAITACTQLQSKVEITDKSFKSFNGVYCQSYSSVMHKASDDFIMSIPFLISRKYENGNSDGMVSAESAKYADYKGNCLDESASHNEIVCFMTKKKKRKKIYAFYKKLCSDLAARGI